jgi:hypothetical protein
MVAITAIAIHRRLSEMPDHKKAIRLDDIIEESEDLGGRVLSAPLVGYDPQGVLRYITAWDVHTTEIVEGEDDLHPFITSARLAFKFGDKADV